MSILTNTSAMVALQTLNSTNKNLAMTQSEISTGLKIADAKDNSAIWAISSVMQSDVKGFAAISESINLGTSTVAVGRQAAETTNELLQEIKGKVVAAQEDNVDRQKIQNEIDELVGQIGSVVGSAQFNGLNLVDGSIAQTNSNGQTGVDILSSLNRDSEGNVTPAEIGVNAQNLSQTAGAALAAAAGSVTADAGTADVIDADDGGTNDSITVSTFAFLDNAGGATGTEALAAEEGGVNAAVDTGLVAGDNFRLRVGSVEANYTVKEGDTAEAIVAGLKNGLQGAGLSGNDFTVDIGTAGELTISNNTNADVAYEFEGTRGSGGLAQLGGIDVVNDAAGALASVEGMIDTAIDAAAAFGSVESRIEIQGDFVGKLSDALETGIGSLVDADLEEASARLQSLQVQQQLGTQALSIANQAPQNVLALFR